MSGIGVAAADPAPGVHADTPGGAGDPAHGTAAGAAAAGPCKFSRTSSCDKFKGTVFVAENGAPVGYARFIGTIDWHTAVNSNTYTAEMTVTPFAVVDEGVGMNITITAACEHPCSATGALRGPVVTGRSLTGTFHFTESTKSEHTSSPDFIATPSKPPLSPVPGQSRAATRIRCDDLIEGRKAGCVVPDYIPTMTTMAKLPKIAKNIRGIQKRGGYGVPGDKARALHHITDEAQQRRNREAMCGRRHTGPRPAGKSCDEYPFASAREGGGTVGGMGSGWAWVPAKEQNSQGGLISGFYNADRVLDGDPFYVEV
ncbi:NucA/NucB deoxyribonuclease domain-containing protein [Actinoallomurus sp. NPDC050550]|uniref:NucA/NucB deoxyribonuclease domain-containing protein n=1 Tax=Actinoallomurus sp. NPDC050550 TaxID=3154937 RepID=UPI003411A425